MTAYERRISDWSPDVCSSDLDQHPAEQAGPAGRRHRRQVGKAEPGLAHRLGDHRVEMLEMRPRRDLRHHAAIQPVLVDLRPPDAGPDAMIGRADGRRLRVTARPDPQDRNKLVYGKSVSVRVDTGGPRNIK